MLDEKLIGSPEERSLETYRTLADLHADMHMPEMVQEALRLENMIAASIGVVDPKAIYGMRCAHAQMFMAIIARRARIGLEVDMKRDLIARLEVSAVDHYGWLEQLGIASMESDLRHLSTKWPPKES
jgi:hypothetical protein